MLRNPEQLLDREEWKHCVEFFSSISLNVGASRLFAAQMDLPRLLFGVGFQIFIVTPQMFRFSREYVENVRS